MQWAEVKNGIITTAPGSLPADISEEDALSYGWMPVYDVNDPPSSEYLADQQYSINEDHIEREWVNICLRPDIVEKENINTTLDNALAPLAAYQNLENPTEQETIDAVKILAGAVCGLIRIQRKTF